jgi:hypothetical protein
VLFSATMFQSSSSPPRSAVASVAGDGAVL